MTEAIFGLIGVVIGGFIPWIQTYLTEKKATRKNARYLAIRVVCIMDRFMEDCVNLAFDDGLSYGQRNKDGYLEPQVTAPAPPVFPNDVDWKSIEHELMYKILSFPSEVEDAKRRVDETSIIANPPDFEEWFLERKFHYCGLGLVAYKLSEELCTEYSIRKKTYNNDWNPADRLKQELAAVTKERQESIERNIRFVNTVLGK